MNNITLDKIEEAKEAAIEVLLHNARGPYHGLPRTAGRGYPEPYTRDLLISIFGIAVSGNDRLLQSMKKVLETLAANQTKNGHIPSLVHDMENRGASDTTPLFLLATGIYRKLTNNDSFLHKAVQKSLTWLQYQSPSDRNLIAQQPTTDWRDEQWMTGFGLFVNALYYSSLRLLKQHEKGDELLQAMKHFVISEDHPPRHSLEGFVIKHKPYFAFWTYKIYSSERFDLLGNSLAILSGIASPTRAEEMISWIEKECKAMRETGDLMPDLPPNFFPFIHPGDKDWLPRYVNFNLPGHYHNGGIWPFICGFYISALVAAKKYKLAENKLVRLTELIRDSREPGCDFGFNEWHKAQDGLPMGEDWQSWSAAMYVYAAHSVTNRSTPFFNEMRDLKRDSIG
jgi:hypothetical protein